MNCNIKLKDNSTNYKAVQMFTQITSLTFLHVTK